MKLSHNIEDYPDGIVLAIDKPYRWTSADVIRKIKYAAIKHFRKKNLKVGHAGTLDPLATGILLVCIGAATKKAEQLQASPKQYLAGVSFGASTASYDLEKEPDTFYNTDKVSIDSINELLSSMVGEQDQVPPLFSAKSIDGIRAYETARKLYKQNLSFDNNILKPSRINLYALELDSFISSKENLPIISIEEKSRINVADISAFDFPTAMIKVDCSKGTYIRAFARDLGEALDSGAFLSSLRRTKNGGYTLADSLTLEQALELLETC